MAHVFGERTLATL
ncbi:putative transposase, partial [Chlamydia psittaci 03DC35]